MGLSLIAELESAVQNGSTAQRIDTLRKITDLLLSTPLSAEQVALFDEIIGRLIKQIEARALKELSERLASVDNAPAKVIRSLAENDEIAISGPVLSMSTRLMSQDLLHLARTKGQAHLLAISARKQLDPELTDVLIERGETEVHRRLAASSGAEFSAQGLCSLVHKAEGDDRLAETLALRTDLPFHLQRQLLATASEAVRTVLMQKAPRALQNVIRQILEDVELQVRAETPAGHDFEDAKRAIHRLHQEGKLDQVCLGDFAKHKRYAYCVTALAYMSSAPVEMIDKLFQSWRDEAFIVPCRAAGLSWQAVRGLLQVRPKGLQTAEQVDQLRSEYAKLSISTAQRVLRFWCVQKAAGNPIFDIR